MLEFGTILMEARLLSHLVSGRVTLSLRPFRTQALSMRHSSSLQRKAGLGSRVAVSCSDWRCRRWPRSVTLERCELTAEGFVRNVGLVIVSMLLSACASRFTPSCAEKFRADSPAIQGRVLSFHPDVHPTHVLTC